jgi:hypothetical protein
VRAWPHRFATLFRRRAPLSTVVEVTEEEEPHRKGRGGGVIRKLRPDMIRRMDDAPKLIDPSGWISEGQSVPINRVSTMQSNRQLAFADGELPAPPSASPKNQVSEKDNAAEHQSTRPINSTTSYVLLHLSRYIIKFDLYSRTRRLSDPGTRIRHNSASS